MILLRFVGRLVLILCVLAALLAVGLKLHYGGGDAFPARDSGAPRLPETALETVADLDLPPGNIAVAANGRVFATLHPEARPAWKVVEIVDGRPRAFPSEAWQTDLFGEPRHFRDVLGIRIDRRNRLWVLDNGLHGLHPARVLAFDVATGALVHHHQFSRMVAGIGSHLNDFQVSPDGRYLYIADASFFRKTPALIVYDTAAERARRLLENHPAVAPDRFVPVVQGRRMEAFGLVAIRPGVDSIALDYTGDWLYFAPITDLQLHRVATRHLLDPRLPAAELAGKVEVWAEKTMSDGLTMDTAGNIYVSDLEHSSIVVMRPDKTLETLVQSERLRWPDGFSFGPDGWLYVTCSSLHHVIGRPPSSIRRNAPYQIFRIKPGADGVPGH